MKNWKTTLAGVVITAGAAMSAAPEPTVALIGKIISILGPAILGLLAKDSDVTGGVR